MNIMNVITFKENKSNQKEFHSKEINAAFYVVQSYKKDLQWVVPRPIQFPTFQEDISANKQFI